MQVVEELYRAKATGDYDSEGGPIAPFGNRGVPHQVIASGGP